MADPLARAIEQLYRVPPSAFTRERNARATALALNDTGLGPATLLALRFPGAIVLAAAFAMASPTPILSGVTPSVLGGVALASFLLIVLPNYINQISMALASPVTVRAVLALGPVLVFGLQGLEGRLPPSTATLTACVLYAVFVVVAAIGRRRAIAAGTADSQRTSTVILMPRNS